MKMEDNNSYKKMYTSNCNLIRINNYKIKIQHNLSHNKTNSKVKIIISKKQQTNMSKRSRAKSKTKPIQFNMLMMKAKRKLLKTCRIPKINLQHIFRALTKMLINIKKKNWQKLYLCNKQVMLMIRNQNNKQHQILLINSKIQEVNSFQIIKFKKINKKMNRVKMNHNQKIAKIKIQCSILSKKMLKRNSKCFRLKKVISIHKI